MELVLSNTIPVTIGAVVAFFGVVGTIVRVYMLLNARMDHIESKLDATSERNRRADTESEEIKAEQKDIKVRQSEQSINVALTAERVVHLGEGMKRIEDALVAALKELRGK